MHASSRVDAARALAMTGVLDVYSGADCAADGLRPIPHSPLPSTRYDMKLTAPGRRQRSSRDRTSCCPPTRRATSAKPWRWWWRKPGSRQPTRPRRCSRIRSAALGDALRRRAESAPARRTCGTKCRTTCWWTRSFGDRGGDRARLCRGRSRRQDEIPRRPCHRLSRSSRARRWRNYDAISGRYTLYAGSGGAVRTSATSLGARHRARRLRVISCDVGGNFGSRTASMWSTALALWASRKLGGR